MRSAVVVTVPEAAPVVDELRLRYTYDAPRGMPAHVTVLFPFVPAERLDEAGEPLVALLREHTAFEATFARTARFPGVLYLAPVLLLFLILRRWMVRSLITSTRGL